MDGFDAPMAMMSPTVSNADAMIQLASRLGAMEQALRGNVTHEKLTNILNEHRRELAGHVRDLEVHLKGVLESHSAQNDKRQADIQAAQDRRVSELFTSLDRMLGEKVGGALKDALKARDEEEDKARKAIDNKAKDAARGVRVFMYGVGPVVGVVIAVVALFIIKLTFGWSPFG